jgi:hypothetical protein
MCIMADWSCCWQWWRPTLCLFLMRHSALSMCSGPTLGWCLHGAAAGSGDGLLLVFDITKLGTAHCGCVLDRPIWGACLVLFSQAASLAVGSACHLELGSGHCSWRKGGAGIWKQCICFFWLAHDYCLVTPQMNGGGEAAAFAIIMILLMYAIAAGKWHGMCVMTVTVAWFRPESWTPQNAAPRASWGCYCTSHHNG